MPTPKDHALVRTWLESLAHCTLPTAVANRKIAKNHKGKVITIKSLVDFATSRMLFYSLQDMTKALAEGAESDYSINAIFSNLEVTFNINHLLIGSSFTVHP